MSQPSSLWVPEDRHLEPCPKYFAIVKAAIEDCVLGSPPHGPIEKTSYLGPTKPSGQFNNPISVRVS